MALITCAECGKQMSDKAAACPHCGAPCPAAPAAEEIKSGECGAVLPKDAEICPSCGCPANIYREKPPQTAQTVFAPPPAYGGEEFESIIIKGKKSPVGRIVCTVIACVLWLAAAAAIGCVIYDFKFAETVGGFYYYRESIDYFSSLAGGKFMEQYWLIIGLAALAVIGAVVVIAGLGKRIKVTNARIVIKRPFKPTPRLTWDRVDMAAAETAAPFAIKSGGKNIA